MEQAPQEQPPNNGEEATKERMRKFMQAHFAGSLTPEQAKLLETPEGVLELGRELNEEIWEKKPGKGQEN